jgi:hypothetical protein
MFKCAVLLLHIQEVLGSNTNPETVYPKNFHVPSQATRQLLGQNLTTASDHITPHYHHMRPNKKLLQINNLHTLL